MNRDFYKDQIEKLAYIYSDKEGNLHLDGDNYEKIVNIKKDKNWNRSEWNKAKRDIDNYLNSSPLKEKFLEEEDFNKRRKKMKKKYSNIVGNFVSGSIPAAIGIGVGLKKKSLSAGVKSALTATAPAIATGKYTEYLLNESERNKKMGRVRRENAKALENKVLEKFKGKKYGYDEE